MGKVRKGNAENAKINGEWGAHIKAWFKRVTSGKRRMQDKLIIRKELEESYEREDTISRNSF